MRKIPIFLAGIVLGTTILFSGLTVNASPQTNAHLTYNVTWGSGLTQNKCTGYTSSEDYNYPFAHVIVFEYNGTTLLGSASHDPDSFEPAQTSVNKLNVTKARVVHYVTDSYGNWEGYVNYSYLKGNDSPNHI